MGALTNLYVSQSYQGLIKLEDSTQGGSGTLQNVQDGLGNNLALQISTTQVNVTGSLLLNGVPVSSGSAGTSGTSGTSGVNGSSGTSGTSGLSGSSGTSGVSGSSGTSGTSGVAGSSGTSGQNGSSGTSGTSGISGSSGSSGSSGISGSSGSSGSSGISGSSGTSGISGSSGSSGINGSSGTSGINGSSGTSGVSGSSGTSGISGSSGTSGVSGSSGSSGVSGSSGTSGVNGSSGTSGTSGINGSSGTSGINGSSGTSGIDGSSGTSGVSGSSGSSGISGSSGTSGVSGSSGSSGIDGSSGTSGINGSSGTSGIDGSSGTSGVSGSSGSSGSTGTSGTSGTSGQNGISAGRTYYFNQSQTSDVSGYKVLSENPTTGATQSVTVSLPGTSTGNTVASFITPELGFAVIPSGVQRFYLRFLKPGSNDDIQAYVTLQLANSAGTPIGPLLASQSELIGWNSGDPTEVLLEYVFPTTNISLTDRMIVIVKGNNNEGAAKNLTFYTENGDYSFVVTSVGVVAGSSGSSGSSGTSGVSGSSGTSGTDGSSGTSGINGSSGTSGTAGSAGTSGTSGTSQPFAQTGSVWATTNALQITGSLIVSSSTVQYDLQVPGQILVANGSTAATTQPRIVVSGTTAAVTINRTGINLAATNSTASLNTSGLSLALGNVGYTTNYFGKYNFFPESGSAVNTYGFGISANPTDGEVAVTGWGGPVMYQYNPNLINYDAFMGLQSVTGWTDGTVSFLYPVDFYKDVSVSGSLVNTGSLYVTNVPSGSTSDQFIVYNTSSGLFERTTNTGGGSIDTSSFATTGSNVFNGNQYVSGSIEINAAYGNLIISDLYGNGIPSINVENGSDIILNSTSQSNYIKLNDNGVSFVLDNLGSAKFVNFYQGSIGLPAVDTEIEGGTYFSKGNDAVKINGRLWGIVDGVGVSSSTASIDLSSGNFVNLYPTEDVDTFVEFTNIEEGQVLNVLVHCSGSATVSFDNTVVKQPSGSAYVPTTGDSKDILTFISFDTSNLYLVSVKNFI